MEIKKKKTKKETKQKEKKKRISQHANVICYAVTFVKIKSFDKNMWFDTIS